MRAIDNALAASSNFLQQLVVAKVSQHLCRARSFLSIRCPHSIIAARVIRLRRSSLRSCFGGVGGCGGQVDPRYTFLLKETKAPFQKASRANSGPRI